MKYILSFLVLFSTSSFANPFFISVGAGGFASNNTSSFTADSTTALFYPTAIGTSQFILPDVNWKNALTGGMNASIALGYMFNPRYQIDMEFLYQNSKRNISGQYNWREINPTTQAVYARSFDNPISPLSSSLHVYSLLTNGSYHFVNTSKWTPLIGGGIGIAWVNSSSTHAINILSVDDPATPLVEKAPVLQHSPTLHGTALAWQFKAGVAYDYSQMQIALVYRLFGTSSLLASTSSITSNPDLPVATTFTIAQHSVSGLLTNALELNFKLMGC